MKIYIHIYQRHAEGSKEVRRYFSSKKRSNDAWALHWREKSLRIIDQASSNSGDMLQVHAQDFENVNWTLKLIAVNAE